MFRTKTSSYTETASLLQGGCGVLEGEVKPSSHSSRSLESAASFFFLSLFVKKLLHHWLQVLFSNPLFAEAGKALYFIC